MGWGCENIPARVLALAHNCLVGEVDGGRCGESLIDGMAALA